MGTDIAKFDVKTRIPAERSGIKILAAQFFFPPKLPNWLWGLTGIRVLLERRAERRDVEGSSMSSTDLQG
jgi:hypothetical protein